MKRLLVLTMVFGMWLVPLRAQLPAQDPQDCAIVAAEYIARLQAAGIPAFAVGIQLKKKATGKRGGHVLTLWQPCKDGDYYISDRTGSVKVPCLGTDSIDAALKAVQKLINQKSDSVALAAVILW